MASSQDNQDGLDMSEHSLDMEFLMDGGTEATPPKRSVSPPKTRKARTPLTKKGRSQSNAEEYAGPSKKGSLSPTRRTPRRVHSMNRTKREETSPAGNQSRTNVLRLPSKSDRRGKMRMATGFSSERQLMRDSIENSIKNLLDGSLEDFSAKDDSKRTSDGPSTDNEQSPPARPGLGGARPSMEKRRSISCSRLSLALEVERMESEKDSLAAAKEFLTATAAPASIPRRKNSNPKELKRNKTLPEGADRLDSDVKAKTMKNHFAIPSRRRKTPMRSSSFSPESGALRAFGIRQESDQQQSSRSSNLPRSRMKRSSSFSSRGNREMFNKIEEMKNSDQRQRPNDNDADAVKETTRSTRSASPKSPKKPKSKLKKFGGAALPSSRAYKKLGSKLTEKLNSSMAGFGNSMSNMFVSSIGPEDFDQLPLEGDEMKEGASGDVPTPMITKKKSSGSKRNKKKGDFHNSMAGFSNSVSGMLVSSIGPEDFDKLPLEGDEEAASGDVPTPMFTKKKSSGSKRNKKGGRYRDVSPATMGRLSASFSQFEAMKKSLPAPELTTKDKKATRKKAKRSKTMSDEKEGKPIKKKSSLRRTRSTSSGGSGISEENRFRRKKSNSSRANADSENKIPRLPSRIKIRRSKTWDYEDPTTKGTAATAATARMAQQQTNNLHVRGNLRRANSDLANYFRGSEPSLTRGRESEKPKKTKKKKSKKKRDKSKDPMYFERNVGKKYVSRRPPSKSVERMKVEAPAPIDTKEPESLPIEPQKITNETETGPVEVTIEAVLAEDMLAAPTGSHDNILPLESEILPTTSGDNGATAKTGIPEWGSKSMVEIFDEHAKKKSSDLMKALLASQGNFLDTDMPDLRPMPPSQKRTTAAVQPSTVTTMEDSLEQRKTELKEIVAESKRTGVKPPLAILKEAVELGVIEMPPGALEKMNLAMARAKSSKKTPPVSPQFSEGAPPTIVQGRVLKNLLVTKRSTEPMVRSTTREISESVDGPQQQMESTPMSVPRRVDEGSDKKESHDKTVSIVEARLPGEPMGRVGEVFADAPQITAPGGSMDTDILTENLDSRATEVEATEVMMEVDALLENTELPTVEDVTMESNLLGDAEAAMHKAMAAMEEAKAAIERIDDAIDDTGGTSVSTDAGSPVVPEEADAAESAVSDEPSIARIQMELHGSPASRSESSRQLWEEVKAGQSHMPMPTREPTIQEEIPELDTTVNQILDKIAVQTKDQKDGQVSLSLSEQTRTKDVEEPVLDLTSKVNTKNKEGGEKQTEAGKSRSAKQGGSKPGKPEFDWAKKAVSEPMTAAGGQTEPMDLITSGAETTQDIEKKAKELGEPGFDWTSKAKTDQTDTNMPNGSKEGTKAEPEEVSLADSQTGLMALITDGTTDEDEESMSDGSESDSDSDDSDSSNEDRFGMSMPNLNLSSSKNSTKKPVAQKRFAFMDSDDSENDSEGTSDSDDDDSWEGGGKQKDSAMAKNPDRTSVVSNNSLNMEDLGQDDSIVTPSNDSHSTMQTEEGFQSMPCLDMVGDQMGALPVFQRKAPRMSIIPRQLSESCSALDFVQFTPKNFVSQREDRFDDHYELGQLLGEGEFGEVFIGYQKQGKGGHGEERAIKIIDKNRMCKGDYEQVINEFNLLKGLTHPNLLTLYGFYEDDGNCYIVTDICKGGELWDELDARGKFDEADTAIFITNLMSAVKFLQSHKIVHRDINLENILLEESKELDQMKIIDFGLATRYEDGVKLSDLVGKVHYVAPQVLEQSYEGSKYDVWSVGVVCYILLSGFAPFEGETDALVMEQVMIGHVDFSDPAWEGISDEAKDFVRHVLEFEEDSRPTAEQALKHAWIQNSIKANTASFMQDYGESSVTCFENIFDFASDASLKLKEAVYTYIASQLLRKEEKEEIDRVFRGMDEDCDGKLSKSDITKGYKRFFDKQLSKKETDKLFERINTSGTGYIDYTEFVIAAMQKSKILDEEKLRAAFSSFDRGDKGFISANDLKVALSGAVALPMNSENGSLSADQLIEEMMKEVDVEGDGKISYQNFASMMLHKTAVSGTPMYISDDDEEEEEEKHIEASIDSQLPNSDNGPPANGALSMDWATASFLGHESDELSKQSFHDHQGTSFHPNIEAIMEDESGRSN